MHKIDAADHVDGAFSDGDPGTGVPGTQVDADWLNAVQGELVNFIETAGGLTLAKGTNTQLVEALRVGRFRIDGPEGEANEVNEARLSVVAPVGDRRVMWRVRWGSASGEIKVEVYLTGAGSGAAGNLEVVRGATWNPTSSKWYATQGDPETGPAFKAVLTASGWLEYDVASDATEWTDAEWRRINPTAVETTITMQNSWVSYDSGERQLGYYKTSDGRVHFVGAVKDGSDHTNAALFSMPAGFRSTKKCMALVPSNASTWADVAVVFFDPASNQVWVATATGNTGIDLSSFSYLADA